MFIKKSAKSPHIVSHSMIFQKRWFQTEMVKLLLFHSNQLHFCLIEDDWVCSISFKSIPHLLHHFFCFDLSYIRIGSKMQQNPWRIKLGIWKPIFSSVRRTFCVELLQKLGEIGDFLGLFRQNGKQQLVCGGDLLFVAFHIVLKDAF